MFPERWLGVYVTEERAAFAARVPAVVAEACERWSLRLGRPYAEGGQCSFVADVQRPDGSPAVLKVCLPHFEGEHEAEGLRFWDGVGAVRLFAATAEALLLERCEPGTPLAAAPEPEQDEVIASILRRLWRPPSGAHPFRPLEDMAEAWWLRSLDRADPTRVDPGLVRAARDTFAALLSSTTDPVLLATDLHAENVLAAAREPWLAIDPKPFIGDRAYDATQHLFNCPERMRTAPIATIERVSGLLSVDAGRVRAWMFARAVTEAADGFREGHSWAGACAAMAQALA